MTLASRPANRPWASLIRGVSAQFPSTESALIPPIKPSADFRNSILSRLLGSHGYYGWQERRLRWHQWPNGRSSPGREHHPLCELERDDGVGSGDGSGGAEFRKAVGVGVGALDVVVVDGVGAVNF